MARTNLPLSPFVAESASGLADPAGTTIDQANGMNIVMTTETIPASYDAERGLFLRVKNTAAGTQHVIVRAGVNPPAFRAPLGDLTVAIATGATVWVGPFDMARHAQADDSINVDFDAGTTGTITAFVAPRNV